MTLPRWLGRMICRFRGHLRGRKVATMERELRGAVNVFECPRCSYQWARKVRAKAEERSRG